MAIINDSSRVLTIIVGMRGEPGVPESGAVVTIPLPPGSTYEPDHDGVEYVATIIEPEHDVLVADQHGGNEHGTEQGAEDEQARREPDRR